jgi:hypothetical protein
VRSGDNPRYHGNHSCLDGHCERVRVGQYLPAFLEVRSTPARTRRRALPGPQTWAGVEQTHVDINQGSSFVRIRRHEVIDAVNAVTANINVSSGKAADAMIVLVLLPARAK